MAQQSIHVDGLRQLVRAADAAKDKNIKKFVRKALRDSALPIQADARRRLTGGVARSESIARTAQGYGISVRRTGIVSVEQRLRKTTGKRPDFGAFQMRRALIPALEANQDEVLRNFDFALDEIASRFDWTTHSLR